MSSTAKKAKTDSKILKELEASQKKIAAIKNNLKIDDTEETYLCADGNGDIILEEVELADHTNDTNEQFDIEETIDVDVNYILTAEQKLHERINKIENKIDQILQILRNEQGNSSSPIDTTHCDSSLPLDENQPEETQQYIEIDNIERLDEMFPISDTATFDWFMTKISRPNSRKSLVEQQASLVRSLNFKTLAIAVKHFINAHVELKVVVEYSVSGYGHHGKVKKKVSASAWASYIHETFTYSYINEYPMKSIHKAVVQYFGRAPDVYGRNKKRGKNDELE